MRAPTKWLVSPAFDLGWFVLPGLLALVLALALGLTTPARDEAGLGLWIAGVLLIDVAHVWATLWRTWLDRQARRLHADLLRWTPALVFLIGFMAHAIEPRLFWGLLAYVAVFHFIKQQVGFVALYLRAARESRRDATLAKLAIWAGTALPVVYWHAHLPRRFAWFMPDDFVAGLPELIGTLAVWAQLPILLGFFARRAWLHARGEGHPMVAILVAITAASWNAGIVWFDDDRVFTLTNVVLHGVPYMALVWIAGGREAVARPLAERGRSSVVLVLAVFYLALLALAFGEEAVWDRLIWHDHPALFGEGRLELDAFATTLVVALLSVPQATHYLLDRWIWKVGPRNPELARQLRLE
ncbi:hypothetical protein ACNOYE_02415 [Nannocystaceae bacterium ST9]